MLALSSVTSLAQLVLCIALGKVHSKELQKCISSLLMLQRARHRVDAPGAQRSKLSSPPQQRALTKLPSKRAEKLLCYSTPTAWWRENLRRLQGQAALTKECICMRFLMRWRSRSAFSHTKLLHRACCLLVAFKCSAQRSQI
jgi:hypothetical protein